MENLKKVWSLCGYRRSCYFNVCMRVIYLAWTRPNSAHASISESKSHVSSQMFYWKVFWALTHVSENFWQIHAFFLAFVFDWMLRYGCRFRHDSCLFPLRFWNPHLIVFDSAVKAEPIINMMTESSRDLPTSVTWLHHLSAKKSMVIIEDVSSFLRCLALLP